MEKRSHEDRAIDAFVAFQRTINRADETPVAAQGFFARITAERETRRLGWKPLLVIGATNYTEALSLKVYTAQRSKEDKVKNPVRLVNAVDELLKTDQPEVLRFYAALTKYQSEYRNVTPVSEMEPQQFVEEMTGIKAVLANPQELARIPPCPVMFRTERNQLLRLDEVKLDPYGISLALDVHQTGPFYEITGTVEAFNKQIPIDQAEARLPLFCVVRRPTHAHRPLRLPAND